MVIIRMVMTTTMPVCECTKLCNLLVIDGGVLVDNLIVAAICRWGR